MSMKPALVLKAVEVAQGLEDHQDAAAEDAAAEDAAAEDVAAEDVAERDEAEKDVAAEGDAFSKPHSDK
jgi:hypothetical protein